MFPKRLIIVVATNGYPTGDFLPTGAGDALSGLTFSQTMSPLDPFPQIFVHDRMDPVNAISGSIRVRDRLRMTNACDPNAVPVADGPAPCVRYQGCAPGYPIAWCETTGQNHGRQDALAPEAFWHFFNTL